LKKLIAAGRIDSSETVVLLLTGHTLKDSEYTIQYHRGDLLREEELTALRTEIDVTRRNPLELDADHDQVLRALDRVAQ
jgi:threonine synthase